MFRAQVRVIATGKEELAQEQKVGKRVGNGSEPGQSCIVVSHPDGF